MKREVSKNFAYNIILFTGTGLLLVWLLLGQGPQISSTSLLWKRIIIFISWGALFIFGVVGRNEEIKARDLMLIGLATLVLVLAWNELNASGSAFGLIYLLLTCLVSATK